MNFSDVLKALNSASAFELYRMRAAIDRVLDEARVTLLCDQRQWRVAYSLLHRVIESHAIEQNALAIMFQIKILGKSAIQIPH